MPMNDAMRGRAGLAGLGLFMTCFVLYNLNSQLSGFFSSTGVMIAIGACSLGVCAKWAIWQQVENKFVLASDWVASFLPILAIVVNVYQVLQYKSDGINGYMAGFALTALFVVGCFGLLDGIAAIGGQKFRAAMEMASEAQHRLHDIQEAAKGQRRTG